MSGGRGYYFDPTDETELRLFRQALSRAECEYKSSFVFNGRKVSVIEAKRTLQYIKETKNKKQWI